MAASLASVSASQVPPERTAEREVKEPFSAHSRVLLPRAPVLDWSSFTVTRAEPMDGVEQVPYRAHVTSGRAALYQALLQLGLPAGAAVLVPTYHCPTMVAPVVCAGLRPVFFALRADGLPDLDRISAAAADPPRAMIVAHYFGLARSLKAVRDWCDQQRIALIEDCAHCYFGQSGERTVGHWGDFAIASLSKFFPVPEGGLLASAHRPLTPLALEPAKLRAEVKGWVDVLEFAAVHGRLRGLSGVLKPLFAAKNERRAKVPELTDRAAPEGAPVSNSAEDVLTACDMGRIGQSPLVIARLLNGVLPRGRVRVRRKENFAAYANHFRHIDGARALFNDTKDIAAPYVFPLWVDDAERVYRAARSLGLPVFRWDRAWPGTPVIAGDTGPQWSRHVLQLLCHQDLSLDDVSATACALIECLCAPT